MGMGSANVFIKEYDLSEIVPSFKGVTGAIVIDSEKGAVNTPELVTTENQLIAGYGKPNPRKYGLGIYSAINFLKESDKLYVVRVDKGQTYASALVRAKIDPIVERDDYGYILAQPKVDPVVKPLGALTAEEIKSFQFEQYARDREVGLFTPGVHLVDKPYDGDTELFVDTISPLTVGSQITFKDTNNLENRDDVLQYKIYTVTGTKKKLIVTDFIETAEDISGINYDDEVKSVRQYFTPTEPNTVVGMGVNIGDNSFYTSQIGNISVGDRLSFDSDNTIIGTVSNLSTTEMLDSLDTPVFVTGAQGSDFVETNDDISSLTSGDTVSINGTKYGVIGVNLTSSPKTITFSKSLPLAITVNPVEAADEDTAKVVELKPNVMNGTTYLLTVNGTVYEYTSSNAATAVEIVDGFKSVMQDDPDITASGSDTLVLTANVVNLDFSVSVRVKGEIKIPTIYTEVTMASPFSSNILEGTHIRKEITQVASYNYKVLAKQIDPANPRKLRVSSNDPLSEADRIEIAGRKYTVSKKYQLENYVNSVTIDQEYFDQTGAQIGDPILDVVYADYEHHDAFLVTAKNPGAWGNRIAIAIRDSANYKDAFIIEVYYDGVLVEDFEVSRNFMTDGFGRQMQMEHKINGKSSYITVKNNEFMVDEDGNMVEPLTTTYYWRQPVATPNYTANAKIIETVWDGDNYIRINSSDINSIDVQKPVKIGDGIYTVAMLQSSQQGGVIDTIVTEEVMELGMDSLSPNLRFLPSGTYASQYFNRAKEVKYTVPNAAGGNLYSITVKSATAKAYSYTYEYISVNGDTANVILQNLANKVNANKTARVRAAVENGALILTSQIAGVDFLTTVSSNLLEEVVKENAREYTYYPLQKISGSIMPKSLIGDTVEMSDGVYEIKDAGANSISGGDDAGYPTVGQYLIALESVFRDPENVDFLVLMDGSITHKAYQQSMIQICESRQDSVALLSVDFDSQANPSLDKGVLEFRREQMINSSYGALYAPWVKAYDKYNDLEIWVSPESYASRAISYISEQRELWYASAGWNNGKVQALDVYKRYTKGERDVMYDNQINPIRFAPGKGMSIWGQKTLQTKPSALDRLNVRMLLIVIERGLRDFLEYQTFKINDDFTRKMITEAVNGFLKDIMTRRGLYGFQVICDESNNTPEVIDRNEMYVDVLLKPVKIAEYITARVAITRSGANFSEVKL